MWNASVSKTAPQNKTIVTPPATILIRACALLYNFCAKYGFAKPPHTCIMVNKVQILFLTNSLQTNHLYSAEKSVFVGAIFRGLSEIHI